MLKVLLSRFGLNGRTDGGVAWRLRRTRGLGFEALDRRVMPVASFVQFSYLTNSTPIFNTGIQQIISGSDGNIWFTHADNPSFIGRMTTDGYGIVTEFHLPTSSGLQGIAEGSDGALWYGTSTTTNGVTTGAIGRITTSGTFTGTFPTSEQPEALALGPDGNIWFTEGHVAYNQATFDKIGRITPSGEVTEFALPNPDTLEVGASITAGPDGALWFTERGNNAIGRITTSGVITEFSLPQFSSPGIITAGPDGALWFTETGHIGRITTNGVVTNNFPLLPADMTEATSPAAITAGADGALWFTASRLNDTAFVGRITTNGVITDNPFVPEQGSFPNQITLGPDKNLWFLESKPFIGWCIPQPPPTPTTLVLGSDPPHPQPDQRVTLYATVQSPPDSNFINSTMTFTEGTQTLGLSPIASNGVSLFVDSFSLGTHTVTATFSGNTFLLGSQATITFTVKAPVPSDGPVVTKLQRFGIHAHPTTLVLAFNRPLDPARAQDVGNYVITGPRRLTIPIKQAVYNAATQTVTLHPKYRLNVHRRYDLTVNGTAPNGLTDLSGRLLDGAHTGHPGSNYSAVIDASVLAFPPTRIRRQRIRGHARFLVFLAAHTKYQA